MQYFQTKMLSIFLLVISATSAFDLNILHTNDVHSHFLPTNPKGGRCTKDDEATSGCFGGAARRLALVRMLRKQHANVILVDAGDQFQVSLAIPGPVQCPVAYWTVEL